MASLHASAVPEDSQMDTKSQMDIVASEDTSILGLAQELDTHTSAMRKAVLDSVRQMRAKITTQASDMIEGERGRSRDYERRLLTQVDGLQRLLDQRTRDLEAERSFSERLVQLHQRQVLRRRTEDLAREGLRRWHKIAQDRKRHERLVAHISKTRKERAARQVFTAWRVEIMQQKHQEKLELTTGEHRRTMARLQSEHQTSENAAKLEMIAMRDNLSKEEERRAILEERLKAAFMRGVCALNMEAMQVLRSAPQDGDVSVASLLQAINLTSSTVDSGADAEPASTDRLMRHQEALQSQLLEMQNALGSANNAGAMVAQSEAVTNPAGGLPSTAERRPYSAGAIHHHHNNSIQQQPHHQQQPIRVTMHSRSPNVGLSAGAGAKRAPSASKPKKLMHDSRAGWRS